MSRPIHGLSALAVAAGLLSGCGDPCTTPENEEILAKAAAEPGAVRCESGLVFLQLRPGYGPKPEARNRVRVHYEGRLADGTVFDSSIERGRPAEFELSGVIAGWTEGLQMLQGGGKARLTIPASLAYGSKGHPLKIPPCAPLVFEVELLGIYD